VQEGGDVTSMATVDKPETVPERASHSGWIHDLRSRIEPLEGTKRLLTALKARDKEVADTDLHPQSRLRAFFAAPGLYRLERAHVLVLSILFEVKPLTGEPGAGNPPARFGGGRDRTQSVLPTPISWPHLAVCTVATVQELLRILQRSSEDRI
jgi:hypothetical protein